MTPVFVLSVSCVDSLQVSNSHWFDKLCMFPVITALLLCTLQCHLLQWLCNIMEGKPSTMANCLHVCLAKVQDIAGVWQMWDYQAHAISRKLSEFHVSSSDRTGVLQHTFLKLFLYYEEGLDLGVYAAYTKACHLLPPTYASISHSLKTYKVCMYICQLLFW